MSTAVNVIAAFVALEHVYFLVLEMFLWTKPLGLKTFQKTLEQQKESAVLAANQGLYNGFLAAGLVWGILSDAPHDFSVKLFFFACVVVAGVYGGMTVSKRIMFLQAGPAALGLALLLASRGG